MQLYPNPQGNAGSEAELRRPSFRDHPEVIIGLLAVSVVAWAYMLYHYFMMHTLPMSEMWMPPTGGAAWSGMDFWMTFVMWSVMMIAMMAPSALPMVMIFSSINRRARAKQRSYVPTFVFVAGYLIAWVGYSAAATIMQWFLHTWSLLTPMMDSASTVFAGGILIMAGIYQWTPWKDACLHKCRTPVGFVLTEWREGIGGALRMGIKHGAYCVGCCWALMLVLFAVGVMNMLWMALITLFVLAEKVLPGSPGRVRAVSGLALTAWGTGLLIL